MIYYWIKKLHVSFFKILCNNARERPSSWECLRRDFFWGGTLSNWISNHIYTVMTSCSQLPVRSGFFCFHVEVGHWPCGLKFVYPMINLAFLGIIVKIKLPAKFCLHSFEWFCLQISSDARYFFSPSKALWSRINSCYSILFSNLKQKTHL